MPFLFPWSFFGSQLKTKAALTGDLVSLLRPPISSTGKSKNGNFHPSSSAVKLKMVPILNHLSLVMYLLS